MNGMGYSILKSLCTDQREEAMGHVPIQEGKLVAGIYLAQLQRERFHHRQPRGQDHTKAEQQEGVPVEATMPCRMLHDGSV